MPQTLPETIECKPTAWFVLRALVIFPMFLVFTILFYYDGTVGYRNKNEVFYLRQTFENASKDFAKQNNKGSLTAETWKAYAQEQIVPFPDAALVPDTVKLPMKWPAALTDYEKMKPLKWLTLWEEYSGERGLDKDGPEHSYGHNAIREQWICVWVCGAISIASAYICLRTWRRRIIADQNGVTDQKGIFVPYEAMKVMDLRKWSTKGLAYVEYELDGKPGKLTLDGLVYGGFKKEQGEPGEVLLRKVKSRFTGRIIDFEGVDDSDEPAKA